MFVWMCVYPNQTDNGNSNKKVEHNQFSNKRNNKNEKKMKVMLPFCNRGFDLNKLKNMIHFLTDQPGFASLRMFGRYFLVCGWVWKIFRGEEKFCLFGRGEKWCEEREDKVGEKTEKNGKKEKVALRSKER